MRWQKNGDALIEMLKLPRIYPWYRICKCIFIFICQSWLWIFKKKTTETSLTLEKSTIRFINLLFCIIWINSWHLYAFCKIKLRKHSTSQRFFVCFWSLCCQKSSDLLHHRFFFFFLLQANKREDFDHMIEAVEFFSRNSRDHHLIETRHYKFGSFFIMHTI